MEKVTTCSKGIQKVMNQLGRFEAKINKQLNTLILVFAVGIALLCIQLTLMF